MKILFLNILLILLSYESFGSVSEDPSSTKSTCTICLEDLKKRDLIWELHPESKKHSQTPHVFHKNCILEWLNKKLECPSCKKDLHQVLIPALEFYEDEFGIKIYHKISKDILSRLIYRSSQIVEELEAEFLEDSARIDELVRTEPDDDLEEASRVEKNMIFTSVILGTITSSHILSIIYPMLSEYAQYGWDEEILEITRKDIAFLSLALIVSMALVKRALRNIRENTEERMGIPDGRIRVLSAFTMGAGLAVFVITSWAGERLLEEATIATIIASVTTLGTNFWWGEFAPFLQFATTATFIIGICRDYPFEDLTTLIRIGIVIVAGINFSTRILL